MDVRWNRGLFRAWIVFAIVWICASGWMIFGPTPSAIPSQYDIPSKKLSDSEILFSEARRVSWVILPPILLLFGGFAAVWTVRGFRD